MRPGKIIRQVLFSLTKKPVTINYPGEKHAMPQGFRGKLKFYPEKCVGCQMCVKDCPSGAIAIKKIAEKEFQAEINLGKCIYCAQCVDSCMKKALEATSEFALAPLDSSILKVTFPAK